MNEHDNAAPEAQHAADEAESDRLFYEVAGEGDGEPVAPGHGDSVDTGDDNFDEAGGHNASRDEKGRFASADDEQGGQGDDPGGDESGQQETAEQELERLRQEAQQWQHRYQSDLGRQNALQRKIQQLEDEKLQMQHSRKPQGQGGEGEGAENPSGSGMSDAEWETLKEDFPDLAKGIEHQLGRVTQQYEGRIQQLEAQLTPIQQQAYEQSLQSELKTLGERHPDYADYATPEGVPFEQLGEKAQRFNAWLSRQPEPVREMMQSNSAADAAYLLDSFKRDTGAGQQQSDADQRQRRNQRRLQSAQSVPSRGGRQRSDIPDSNEDALFDYYAAKVDQ